MKWHPMKTAPRDGSPVLLVYYNFSGVVAARFGESKSGGQVGWFNLDFDDTVGNLCDGSLLGVREVEALTDDKFAGWVAIPEPSKKALEKG